MRNVCLLALLTIQNFALPLLAAERNSDSVTDVDPKNAILPDQLAPHREEIARKLETLQKALKTAQGNGDSDQPADSINRQIAVLKQLDVLAAQRQAVQVTAEELDVRYKEVKAELVSVQASGPTEQKPFSFLLLDRLQDKLESKREHSGMMNAAVRAAADSLERSRKDRSGHAVILRQTREAVDKTGDEEESHRLQNGLKIAELEHQLMIETVALRQQESDNRELEQDIHAAALKILVAKVEWIQQDVTFSRDDLQDALVVVQKEESDLERKLESAQVNLEYASQQWVQVRQKLDATADPNHELREEVEAKRVAHQWWQQQISILNQRLLRLQETRSAWNRRYKVITSLATPDELIAWSKDTSQFLDELVRERRLLVLRVDELRQDMTSLNKKLQSHDDSAQRVAFWIRDQQSKLQLLIQNYDEGILNLETSRRLHGKLLKEIQGNVRTWSFSEWVDGLWHYVTQVWNKEITEDGGRSVTVGKIVVGIILLLVGFILSRKLSKLFGVRLQQNLGMDQSAVSALQTVSFYVLLVIATLTALRFVNVPLSMFTFMGGAIAIGVGLGSQSVVNNFISGLVLLAERPIKVGDLIQMDDLYGNVEHIGPRSTVIRTGENLEIIVPNSAFLENNVFNLTLGDSKLRTYVSVGVAYGTSTRELIRLLKRAAVEHGRVLKHPDPFVWFVEFGDNALTFQLHFWLQVRTVTERMRVESDIRLKVEQLLRDANIVVAFPQRDLHLDVEQPIPVRMLPVQSDPEPTPPPVKRRVA